MDSKTYIANALKTESVPAKLEINLVALHAALELAVNVGEIVDQFKRRLFYGKEITIENLGPKLAMVLHVADFLGQGMHGGELNVNTLITEDEQKYLIENAPQEVQGISLANLDIRLLHAAVGCFTESAELVDAMKKQLETGKLDRVNFGEEVGDIEWYQAIGFDASGVSEESCREKNIAKLKARYPGKFDAAAAINRDVEAERVILAGGE